MIPDLLNIILDYAGNISCYRGLILKKYIGGGLSRNNHDWAIAQLKLHPEKIDWRWIINK